MPNLPLNDRAMLIDEMVALATERHAIEAQQERLAQIRMRERLIAERLQSMGYTAEQLDDICEQRTGSRF